MPETLTLLLQGNAALLALANDGSGGFCVAGLWMCWRPCDPFRARSSANIIAMMAARRALGIYFRHLRGEALAWDKTSHRFPDLHDKQRRMRRRRASRPLRFMGRVLGGWFVVRAVMIVGAVELARRSKPDIATQRPQVSPAFQPDARSRGWRKRAERRRRSPLRLSTRLPRSGATAAINPAPE